MQYFAGVVPPEPFLQQAVAFQKRWPRNRLPQIVEPHITVKAQDGLTEDLDWLDKFKEVCRSFPPFKLSLAAPSSFGRAVVYLSVESEQLFELHRRFVHTVSPTAEQIERYMELDRYVPHLTLGQTRWGMTEPEIDEMKSAAAEALAPFSKFTVSQVRIYREIEPDKYVPFEDISLKQR